MSQNNIYATGLRRSGLDHIQDLIEQAVNNGRVVMRGDYRHSAVARGPGKRERASTKGGANGSR